MTRQVPNTSLGFISEDDTTNTKSSGASKTYNNKSFLEAGFGKQIKHNQKK